ncbi:hypothetical protein H261_22323 [Paramagnetospirillum caucaseum]|jgi:hypothetical protein|uniref:Uncharacterized protein n=1 Tax=Paramagnetospirillum caucaseum TaxID=1244869 RepID=M3A4A3_9PROT|nr:hypothetical protein [Paramagnetospirillum caucaseum]EME67673.1 hypothetical protein H261_22323 [Paramagnetospirillum caucaseum]
MSDSVNKEEALAIIRGIVGAATDIAKMASEMGQEDDEITAPPPPVASPPPPPPPASAHSPAPAENAAATEPAEKAAIAPKAEVRASSQADVLNQLLNRKSGKA